ncbi:MAG: hypothetical protein PHV42_04450, partial [Candidatus Pacebacteria bacterium]|nr:hypothetical protein [Candidatus Paceibacterota bacterium]
MKIPPLNPKVPVIILCFLIPVTFLKIWIGEPLPAYEKIDVRHLMEPPRRRFAEEDPFSDFRGKDGKLTQSRMTNSTVITRGANPIATNAVQVPDFVFQPQKTDPKYFRGIFENIHPLPREPDSLGGYQRMDYTATNLELRSSHKPVIIGQSNGMWIVRFESNVVITNEFRGEILIGTNKFPALVRTNNLLKSNPRLPPNNFDVTWEIKAGEFKDFNTGLKYRVSKSKEVPDGIHLEAVTAHCISGIGNE